MYALIQSGTITAIGQPLRGARRLDTGQWVTPPADGWTPDLLAACGWLPVVEVPRPADTATHTSDWAPVALVVGVPTQQWMVRPWTAEELAAKVEAAAWEAQQAADRAALDALAATADAAHTDGEPWQQPTGAHDAYPLGAAVTHGGKTWESLIPFNVWAPGVSGWRERVAVGYPAWVQPTGGHDAYPVGAIVTHAGQTWQSTADANVWQPGVYGWTIHTA